MTPLPLPEGSWWEWAVRRFDGARLLLVAGYDLSYHHGLEVELTDVSYLRCPTAFLDPVFREPTAEEAAEVVRVTGGEPSVLLAFEADGGGTGAASCLIAAEAWAVRQGRFPG
ncbi:hypothetical protein [Streptomyces termitum]|uniref:hypothetical protein n=1 Tax=Streptomyces termitum TaxID=67368 RepID=UPI0037B27AAB